MRRAGICMSSTLLLLSSHITSSHPHTLILHPHTLMPHPHTLFHTLTPSSHTLIPHPHTPHSLLKVILLQSLEASTGTIESKPMDFISLSGVCLRNDHGVWRIQEGCNYHDPLAFDCEDHTETFPLPGGIRAVYNHTHKRWHVLPTPSSTPSLEESRSEVDSGEHTEEQDKRCGHIFLQPIRFLHDSAITYYTCTHAHTCTCTTHMPHTPHTFTHHTHATHTTHIHTSCTFTHHTHSHTMHTHHTHSTQTTFQWGHIVHDKEGNHYGDWLCFPWNPGTIWAHKRH